MISSRIKSPMLTSLVADLTHNNPNVHLELGIALTQNKNILRVSGRSLTELGFDIRNLEMYAYKDAEDLLKKITGYLDTFFKNQTTSNVKRER